MKKYSAAFALLAVFVLAAFFAIGIAGCGTNPGSAAKRPKLESKLGKELHELGASVQESGGQVVYVDFYATPKAQQGLPLLANDAGVRTVVLSQARIGDDELAPLGTLANLEELALNGTKITDAGLDQLKGLAHLKRLNLNETQIGDEGLARLKDLQGLEGLNLHATKITDDGLSHLESLSQLKYVWLSNTKVTPEGVARLRKALPGTNVLDARERPKAPPAESPAENPPAEK